MEGFRIMKTWTHVENALRNIYDVASYYIGGTLCIDFPDGKGIALNSNGTGFVFNFKKNHSHLKNAKLYQPSHIRELVQKIYEKEKHRKLVTVNV